jgi:hypothetical protein
MQKKLFFNLLLISIFIFNTSCGIYKYSDARKNPVNADERIKKNMEEGKGFRLGQLGGNKSGGEFQFATSNPMWRAAIAKLDFAPLNTVDYAGGIIITDWFSDGNSNDEIKLTIRFLTNEIRSDAIAVIIHKKKCNEANNCKITKIENKTNSEIRFAILKKAAQIKSTDLKEAKKKNKKYKIPGKKF